MSVNHPEAGLRVGDRYVLTQRVATGGMGEVWRAQDDVLGREVAVKVLRREYAEDETFLTRFRGEARHAASLAHPGIAAVYDYGEVEGVAYLVMELVPGEPLSARLAREGALPAAVAVPLLQQAADALQAAHAGGLVHRDVKPANLLITPDERVKITDFGIARAGDQVPITRTGEVMGTAQYLSPEQALGRNATASSDVYALGVVAYEALAGRRPFEGETPVATALAQVNDPPPPLPEHVPAPVANAVLTAMAKDPADRPESAAAFGAGLGTALDGLPSPAVAPATQLLAPATAGVPTARTSVLPAVGAAAIGAGAIGAGAIGAGARRWARAGNQVPPRGPADSRRGELIAVLAALLLVALVALALTQFRSRPTSSGPTTPAASLTAPSTPQTPTPTEQQSTPADTPSDTPTPTPEIFTLDPDRYVGRNERAVRAELEAMGLIVKTRQIATKDAKPGTVTDLSPTKDLHAGDTVVLKVAVKKQDPPPGGGEEGD